jgi:hypothetical protein
MSRTRICKLSDCGKSFDPIVPHQVFHSEKCANLDRVRRWRKNHRKKGGGGGGGNGGGGLTLFDTIVPQDPQATYVPDTCYRTLQQ